MAEGKFNQILLIEIKEKLEYIHTGKIGFQKTFVNEASIECHLKHSANVLLVLTV